MKLLLTIGACLSSCIVRVKQNGVQKYRRTWVFPRNWCVAWRNLIGCQAIAVNN